jgi:hypothetical protein
MDELVPRPAAGAGTLPGQKLGTTAPGQPMPNQPMGGKVGQPVAVPGQPVPTQPTGGSGFGGAGTTPPPVPTPVPAQPTGGSGFGGAGTTPPPVPAQPVQPVPAQPAGDSGFGGK